MIGGFRDGWLEAFFRDDARHRRIPPDLEDRLFRKLQLVDDAASESDLRVPPGNSYERLSGHLVGWSSIRVNQQWRLIFRWIAETGEAVDIYLDDHSYR